MRKLLYHAAAIESGGNGSTTSELQKLNANKKTRNNLMATAWNWLRSFFLNYLWLGIAILLISILMDKSYPEPARAYWVSIFIKVIEGIGVAILIASIFTFASGTSEFVGKIKALLESIVIRRDFLANIDPDAKKDALKALIQPSASEKNKYPNIGDYYGYFINKTLEIKQKSVRSNYAIQARAFYCSTKKINRRGGNLHLPAIPKFRWI